MGVTLLSENEFADSAVVHECHGYAHRKKKLVSSQRSNGGVSPQGYQAQQVNITGVSAWVCTALGCDPIPCLIAACSSSSLSSTNTIYPLPAMLPPCLQVLEKLWGLKGKKIAY